VGYGVSRPMIGMFHNPAELHSSNSKGWRCKDGRCGKNWGFEHPAHLGWSVGLTS